METPDSTLKVECSNCGQHILVDQAYSGMSGNCPACDQAIDIPEFAPSLPKTSPDTRPVETNLSTPKPPSKAGKSPLAAVQSFICGFSGLKRLQDFELWYLFSQAPQRRSRADIDTYFNCGCPQSTPDLADVPPDWPRPWFFWRMLVFGFLVLSGFCVAFESFHNPLMIPGLIIIGAFFVPLACVALFFEFNVLRNISLYQVIKFIVCGGIVSLIIALFLFSTTHLDFLGAMSAGLVEETAKVLTAVLLLRNARQYKWILNGLLVGAAVGGGFAGFESAGYIFRAFFECVARNEGLSEFYQTLALRAVLSPFGHVVWTASVVGALWRVKKDQPFRANMFFHKDFVRILVFVMLLHMLWNSGLLFDLPKNVVFLKGESYLWLLSFVGSWYLALLLVQEGLLQVKAAQSFMVSSPEELPVVSLAPTTASGSPSGERRHLIYAVIGGVLFIVTGIVTGWIFSGASTRSMPQSDAMTLDKPKSDATTAAAAARVQYAVIDLGTLGGTSSEGLGINASGQVAGWSHTTHNSTKHAVRWTGMTPEDLGTLGGDRIFGYGINDSGQVVGQGYLTGNSAQHAVRWTGTKSEDLGTFGGDSSLGYGINAAGQIAGESYMGKSYRGKLYGGIRFIDANTIHAVRWTGKMLEDLDTLGGIDSHGYGINASGQVAGVSDVTVRANGARHAVRWTGTKAEDLGTLGGADSHGYAINAAGDITGMSYLRDNTARHAFLYTGGVMYDLNDLLLPGSGVTALKISEFGNSINDVGQIAATGTIGGHEHALRLDPVATP